MTKKKIEQPPVPKVVDEIRAVVNRAKTGDTTVLPRLRELLARYPELWQRYGDLATQAQMAWANLAAGSDLYLRESVLRMAEALREELAGSSPSPIERLLVERVVACWLQLHYSDAIEAQSLNNDEKPRLAAYRAKRQEQAHRMYLTSLAALTTLRKLLPTTPMNNHRNGHSSELPMGVHNRLAGYFDEPPLDAKKGQRKPKMAGVAVDD